MVAVNDGVIKAIGSSPQLGRYIVLQDAYGNRYTYGQLGEIVRDYPVPKPQPLNAEDFKLITPAEDKKPTGPATKTTVKDNALNTTAKPRRSESEGPGPKPGGPGLPAAVRRAGPAGGGAPGGHRPGTPPAGASSTALRRTSTPPATLAAAPAPPIRPTRPPPHGPAGGAHPQRAARAPSTRRR